MTFRTSGFALLGLCASLVACTQPAATKPDATPQVAEAWVRLPAVPDRPAAAYFTIAGGAEADVLGAVASGQATRIELHDNMDHDGSMHMQQIAKIDVPAGGTVALEPGGRHAMLFGVDPSIRPGSELSLRLRFEKAGEQEVRAKVIGAGDPPPY